MSLPIKSLLPFFICLAKSTVVETGRIRIDTESIQLDLKLRVANDKALKGLEFKVYFEDEQKKFISSCYKDGDHVSVSLDVKNEPEIFQLFEKKIRLEFTLDGVEYKTNEKKMITTKIRDFQWEVVEDKSDSAKWVLKLRTLPFCSEVRSVLAKYRKGDVSGKLLEYYPTRVTLVNDGGEIAFMVNVSDLEEKNLCVLFVYNKTPYKLNL
jgi:hypothetical protein